MASPMRVRLVVTLDVDARAWATEYGVPVISIPSDVRTHVQTALHGHYVDDLGVVTGVTVVRRG